MPWLFLLSGLCLLAVGVTTRSVTLAAVSLVAAVVLLLLWVLGLVARRVGSQTRDTTMMLSPEELRRLRKHADKRTTDNDASPDPP